MLRPACLEAIRTVQAAGPYFLGGGSVGGMIAFAMAQQLSQQGQEVALLVLLDPSSPRTTARRPLLQRLKGVAKTLMCMAVEVLPKDVDAPALGAGPHRAPWGA
ncbi:MAG: hypothetical protein FJZ47_06400 [Candidatus Tectomicrobia bacterium]|uniref:Thioesterase domain-containing protein n=1 Tax=Tectimicrobiota bacterium TaxID=2528274 RepID=A0A937W0C4_UNCTE|nr:hypothetical protein [Candidatus Tectomicrobia bacterium]